jgi:predicted RNA binding protein YcfA (HicA-like mRNA interferase family)
MPRIGPIKRRDLIYFLRELGFTGPYAGGNHEYMERGKKRVPIPNPHQGDIGVGLLKKILKTAGISDDEWEQL